MTAAIIVIALIVIGILQARVSSKYRQAELYHIKKMIDTDNALNELKGR